MQAKAVDQAKIRRYKVAGTLERRQRRAKRSGDHLDCLTWTMVRRRLLGPGKPFDLARHLYLVDIYADECPEAVFCKAGQMGLSDYAISWMLWSADEREATGLYVFPTDGDVSDFSAARLGPAIEPNTSPYLANLIVAAQAGGQRGADRVGLKRVGDRFIYFRGGQVKKDGRAPQLHSIDADVLVLDEYDQMDTRVPAIARERLGHSQIKEARAISTPTFAKVGIHAEWLSSDQRLWHVRCTGCGRRQDLTIDDLVTEWDDLNRPAAWHKDADGRPFLACRQCGGAMDRLGQGEWVPTYPGRSAHGYHLSRLFAAHCTLDEILDSLDTVDETERQQAYNQGLGLPYRSPSAVSLTDEVLDECRRDYGLGPRRDDGERGKVFCGVDVGAVLNVVIREVLLNGDRPARYIGTVGGFDDVAQLMQVHGVSRCVVDALPETRQARALQRSQGTGKVWLAYYVTQKAGSKKQDAVDWDETKGTVNMDRTRTLDKTLGLFATASRGEGGNTLPANARDLPGYYAQLKALERKFKEASDGNQVAVYTELGPDHYSHAENYCYAASQTRGSPLLGFI